MVPNIGSELSILADLENLNPLPKSVSAPSEWLCVRQPKAYRHQFSLGKKKEKATERVVGASSFLYRTIDDIPTKFMMRHPGCLAVIFLQHPKDKRGLYPEVGNAKRTLPAANQEKGILHIAGGVVKC